MIYFLLIIILIQSVVIVLFTKFILNHFAVVIEEIVTNSLQFEGVQEVKDD